MRKKPNKIRIYSGAKEEEIKATLHQVFHENNQVYGSRCLSDALNDRGIRASRYKVKRWMNELGLNVRYPKKFKITTDSNHSEAISANKLDRQFTIESPNKVWTTDITYLWTLEGCLYVAVVFDLFSRQVVGWAVNDHMRTSLCTAALQMAFWRRKPKPGLLPWKPACK